MYRSKLVRLKLSDILALVMFAGKVRTYPSGINSNGSLARKY